MPPPKGKGGPARPPSRVSLKELKARQRRRAPAEEDPPPLGPPPGADAIPDVDDDLLFQDPTTMDADPTHRLRKLEMAEAALLADDDPTGNIELDETHQVDIDAPPSRRRAPVRRGPGARVESDWPEEPPELPEPPVQFAPPEMTMPPRLPDPPSVPPPLRGADLPEPEEGRATDKDASRYAEELGTPELPDVTPSSLPEGMRRKLRETKQTTDLRSAARQAARRAEADREYESTVVSQVVDMPLGVMRPSAESEIVPAFTGTPSEPDPWATEGSLSEEGSADGEYVTSIWSAENPPMLPRKASPSAADAETVMESVARLPPTELIAGRYRVLERVGQGGMARIFRVQHAELGKDFALKIIHTALSDDTKVKEMFYREARLASSLDHPNIVLLTDFGVDQRYGAFIVMEYLKGESLHARLRREGKLHQNVVLEVALQMAEALHFIHKKDIVHCDIKSENVFLCEPPPEQRRKTIIKLLDFGLSREKIASDRVSLSEVGGTPAYMAPERINRMSPRPSMDIYSLGILMYEMITGTLPFTGTMEEVLIAQLNQMPVPPSQRVKEGLDDRVNELVMKALQKRPEDRQKDMGAFMYELRTVMDMLGIGRRRGKQAARAAANTARVKNCELLVADCPLPLFMTDVHGNLAVANQAFASFVNLTVDQCAGMLLTETRLGRICPEIVDDLKRTMTSRKQSQRILSFPWRSSKQVSMMIWLTPEIIDKQVVGVVGVVHPFSTTTAPAH